MFPDFHVGGNRELEVVGRQEDFPMAFGGQIKKGLMVPKVFANEEYVRALRGPVTMERESDGW
jgi:carbamate kinase